MKLLLAPMEGVVDSVFRDLISNLGGLDQCVTEFTRVTTLLLPDHVFYRYCPELFTNSRTRAGTPVFFQLLGGEAEPLALNAARAAELGAAGIDLNFGCPAKTVNRHDGGAALLKAPERIFKIIKACRQTVPAHIPVTAKIRLGFDDPAACLDNAQAVAEAGANWLTVHARTKTDGYRPPAYWDWLPKIKASIQIPVIANGEVWSVTDYHRCREVSLCNDVMIGRGALSDPFIFRKIKSSLSTATTQATPEWPELQSLLPGFYRASEIARSPQFALSRSKQWLKALALKHQEAKVAFELLKVLTDPQQFRTELEKLSGL